jgi:hypothetical protein
MSPLFRKSPEKRARQAAAQTEIDRVKTLDVADLAAQLLPAMGRDGPGAGHTMRQQQLCEYMLRDVLPSGNLKALEVMSRVTRALDMLEGAGLVEPTWLQRSPVWRITPLGESTLAEGTVRARLG